MTDLDRALKDALVLGLENDATAEHILRIAAPFIDRAFQDQNNRIKRLEAALREIAADFGTVSAVGTMAALYSAAAILAERISIARKALEGKDD